MKIKFITILIIILVALCTDLIAQPLPTASPEPTAIVEPTEIAEPTTTASLLPVVIASPIIINKCLSPDVVQDLCRTLRDYPSILCNVLMVGANCYLDMEAKKDFCDEYCKGSENLDNCLQTCMHIVKGPNKGIIPGIRDRFCEDMTEEAYEFIDNICKSLK